MYSLWDSCYHIDATMARKGNLVEKLAAVSCLIEINVKPLYCLFFSRTTVFSIKFTSPQIDPEAPITHVTVTL